MNDHLFFLLLAYTFTGVCMVWEAAALLLRRRNAIRKMSRAMEDEQ